jgi:hypothetical protein
MKYAVVLANDGDQHALVKSDNDERIQVIAILCRQHIHKLFPQAICEVSTDRSFNAMVEMHPDREWIIDKLRGYEFPLPSEVIIEGVYRREAR